MGTVRHLLRDARKGRRRAGDGDRRSAVRAATLAAGGDGAGANPVCEAGSRLAGRRLLVLNWRDIVDPQAGGAEAFCWAVTSRFAAGGADVTLFTGQVPGRPHTERRDGVRVVRRGGPLSLYAWAAAYMKLKGSRFDAVVEAQNGIPFFAPLFVPRRLPVIRVMHHVHQEQFRHHFPWPVSSVGRFLENRAARAVYGCGPVAVVSPSTRQDVRGTLGSGGPLYVVPNGSSSTIRAPHRVRAMAPTIISVGRLSKHKRIDILIRYVPELCRRWSGLHVHIVGDGPERRSLEALARELGVADEVTFHGQVSSMARDAMVAGAWIAVVPSDGEGWCLSVIEANAAGVPAVGRAVVGLRDSIRPGLTGWLAEGERDFCEVISRALGEVFSEEDSELWAGRCRHWASQFSWDSTADRLAKVVAGELAKQGEGGRGLGRRERSDLGCILEVELDDPQSFELLAAQKLRSTDLYKVVGDRAHLLFQGCDQREAVARLRRLGFGRVTAARVAASHDLLVGPRPGDSVGMRDSLP